MHVSSPKHMELPLRAVPNMDLANECQHGPAKFMMETVKDSFIGAGTHYKTVLRKNSIRNFL